MAGRRSRYSWFPTNPTFIGEETTGLNYWDDSFELAPLALAGTQGLAAFPLLQDGTIEADEGDAFTSLRDRVEGQDYVVERIVGKVWFDMGQANATGAGEYVAERAIFAAGICVLPTADETNQPALPPADYDPLLADNAAAPWAWRRTWILYNNFAGYSQGPQSVGAYGSMADGGHVDMKSVRRVTKEQRLYIVCAARVLTTFVNGEEGIPIDLINHFGYDLRVLGAMRKARNKSTFK